MPRPAVKKNNKQTVQVKADMTEENEQMEEGESAVKTDQSEETQVAEEGEGNANNEGEGDERMEEGGDTVEDGDPSVLMKMYISSSNKMLRSADIKKFLNGKDVKVMEVNQPEWLLCAQVRVCETADRDKTLALNGSTVSGFNIKFEVDGEPLDNSCLPTVSVQPRESYVVKVQGLSADATVKDLQELFPTASEIRLPVSKAGEKRTAFLEFNTKEEANKVVSSEVELHEQTLTLEMENSPAVAKDVTTTDENKKVLFIGNLVFETTEETVKNYFKDCLSVRLLKFGDTGNSKGMGFIHFRTAEDALKALIEKKDTKLEGRQILLQFADGERRTAKDYRNKPPKTDTRNSGRERSRPYSSTGVSRDRWYSRAEVEKGMSFANEDFRRGMTSGYGGAPGGNRFSGGRGRSGRGLLGQGPGGRGYGAGPMPMGRGFRTGMGAPGRGFGFGGGYNRGMSVEAMDLQMELERARRLEQKLSQALLEQSGSGW